MGWGQRLFCPSRAWLSRCMAETARWAHSGNNHLLTPGSEPSGKSAERCLTGSQGSSVRSSGRSGAPTMCQVPRASGQPGGGVSLPTSTSSALDSIPMQRRKVINRACSACGALWHCSIFLVKKWRIKRSRSMCQPCRQEAASQGPKPG